MVITTTGQIRLGNRAALITRQYTRMRGNMVPQAIRMPAANWGLKPSLLLDERAKCRVRAVDELRPANKLVDRMPLRAPATRMAKEPTNEMDAIITTIRQISRGFKAPPGPM